MATKQDLVRIAVRGQHRIPRRAEKQDLVDHEQLFVEHPDDELLEALRGASNQIVFGRRGTGKTMLFRKLLREGSPEGGGGDFLAIMLQSEDFLRSPDTTDRDPPVVRARSYFREFLRVVADRMYALHDEVSGSGGLLARFNLADRARKEVFSDRVLRLNNILQYGAPVVRPSGFAEKSAVESVVSRKSARDFNVEAKTDLRLTSGEDGGGASASIGGGFAAQHSNGHESSRAWERESELVGYADLGAPEIRILLREIVEMLGVKQLVILLDEWQSLGVCQVEFAQHLKSCFFGLDCVSLKLSAYRHVCRFNNGGSRDNFRGIEVGQDVSDAGETDLSPTDASTRRFMFHILYRRLLHAEPRLDSFYGPPHLLDEALLAGDLFRSNRAAEMMVRGCHGVLRDFLEAFNYAAKQVGHDVARNPISVEHVEEAYGVLSRQVQDNVQSADDIGGLLFELVKPLVHETGAPFFFVKRNDNQWQELLRELVEKRAIHVLDGRALPPGADSEWVGYEVAYGLFHEWSKAAAFTARSGDSSLEWRDVRDLHVDDFDDHVLGSAFRRTGVRVCVECGEQYSTGARPYLVRRLCPHCYADQPEED